MNTTDLRRTASEWYAHGSTELYKLASTGYVSPDPTDQEILLEEIEGNRAIASKARDREDLESLADYVRERIAQNHTGTVAGWEDLHW